MTTDTGTFRSRRAVLGAALGGAAAVAAQAALPLAARGATGDGQAAQLGTANTSTTETSFENTDPAETSLVGLHAGGGTGVQGTAATGPGVRGYSTDVTPTADWTVPSSKTGVIGSAGDPLGIAENTDETGVYGVGSVSTSSTGVWGDSPMGTGVVGSGAWGVYGTGGAGVVGDVDSASIGVYGFAGDDSIAAPPTAAGIGVLARAGTTSQFALWVEGKARFSRSGRKAIGRTATSLKVSMSGVTTSSYVIATLQTSVSGCYVRAVVPTAGAFTIYLSKAPGKTVYVGYLVIN